MLSVSHVLLIGAGSRDTKAEVNVTERSPVRAAPVATTRDLSVGAWLGRRVFLPAYEQLAGRRFWSEHLRLSRLQWCPPDELAARATQKLRSLVAHAEVHVPLYRDLYHRAGVCAADLRTLDDLTHIPIVQKSQLRAEFPERTVADDLPASRRWRTITSGSTGFPFEFFTDAASADGIAASYLFFLGWAEVGPWHGRIDITNRNRPMTSPFPTPSRLVGWARRMLFGERALGLGGVDLSPDTFVARVRGVLRRGYFIRGYPSYMTRLAARLLESRAALPAPPQVVVSLGETLTALDASTIEQAFGSRVVNQYSAWEAPHMAQTCPDSLHVLHVNSDRVILRVLRDDGTPARPGEQGRIVMTALDNHVMPFINYDIGDSAVSAAPCPCGRGLPTLQSVEGRLAESIRTPGGRVVSGTTLDGVFRSASQRVREFQAVQTAADAITLRVVPTPAWTPETAAELEFDLRRYTGPDVRVCVEVVSRIDSEPSGKRLVVKVLRADLDRRDVADVMDGPVVTRPAV